MGLLATEREVAALAVAAPRCIEIPAEPASGPSASPQQGRIFQMQAVPPKPEEALVSTFDQGADQSGENSLERALTFPAGPNLSEEDRAEAERRYGLIEPILKGDRTRRRALVSSVATEHGLGRSTVYGWLAAFEKNGLRGLVRRDRADKGFSRRLHSAALDFILAAALPKPGVYGEMSVKEIFRAYEEERVWRAAQAGKPLSEDKQAEYRRYVVPETGCLNSSGQLPKASYETFRVWVNRIPEPVRVFAREGEDSFHDTQEILSYRDLEALKPLDFVVMDHRMLDIFAMVRSKRTWRLVRPWLTAAIDMRTRKWLGWVIVEVPSSDSIASVLKRVFLGFGVPRAVYWDNGKDFRCEWFEGGRLEGRTAKRVKEVGDGMRGILESLGVRVHHAIVRRARSKIIEANFVNVANFDRALPYWCGHKPTTRPARFEALLEEHARWLKGEVQRPPFPMMEEVAALYDDLFAVLNEREHEGEGMSKPMPNGRGWMCPNECWEGLIGGVERRTISAELLGFCFQKRRKLTVRHGEIQATFGGRTFHYRILSVPLGLMELNERKVEFGFDPLDLETGAIYYQHRFVGLVNCVELRRMGETAFVGDERDRRAARKAVKKLVEAVHSQVWVPGPGERLARRLPVLPVRSEPGRPEIAARVPAALVEAAKAREEEQRPVEAIEVPLVEARPVDPEEGRFEFFSKGAA